MGCKPHFFQESVGILALPRFLSKVKTVKVGLTVSAGLLRDAGKDFPKSFGGWATEASPALTQYRPRMSQTMFVLHARKTPPLRGTLLEHNFQKTFSRKPFSGPHPDSNILEGTFLQGR